MEDVGGVGGARGMVEESERMVCWWTEVHAFKVSSCVHCCNNLVTTGGEEDTSSS